MSGALRRLPSMPEADPPSAEERSAAEAAYVRATLERGRGGRVVRAVGGRPPQTTCDLDPSGSGPGGVADVGRTLRDVPAVEAEDDGAAFAPETVRGGLIRGGRE